MKKVMLSAVLAAVFFAACSKDDGPAKNCESCTSEIGNEFEICDNGDGTYDFTQAGETATISEAELEGFSPKLIVESACEFDSDPDF